MVSQMPVKKTDDRDRSLVIDMTPVLESEDQPVTHTVELPPGTVITMTEVDIQHVDDPEHDNKWRIKHPTRLEITVPHGFANVERWEHG